MRTCTVFGMLALFICPVIAQSTLPEDPELAASTILLSTWIEETMDYQGIPGMAVGVVYDQELLWARGFGFADLENEIPMTPQTLSRIASITKTFTATAIMQLAEAGKLRLDDAVRTYLPWFTLKNRFTDAPEITIRQLLTHTAGLPGEAAFPYWTDHRFPTREQIMATLPEQELIFPPGYKLRYSNLGLALAGEVVAAAAGMPYQQYIEEHILNPLQMNSTFVVLPEKEKKRLATSYDYRRSDGSRNKLDFPECNGLIPAANLTSNVQDLARYISAHLGDGKKNQPILSIYSLREMHRVHWLNPEWESGRGLGFYLRKRSDRTLIGHGGWVAGYKSHIVFCHNDKIGVIVLSNCADAVPTTFAYRIYEELAPLILKLKRPPAATTQASDDWDKYIGDYEDLCGWQAKVMRLNDKLVLYQYDYPANDAPRDGLIELVPEGAQLFRMSAAGGNGETVRFELDDRGRVARLWKGENYFLPVNIKK
ncbi:beta-lactamase family protein [candidate division KSB1 bacterium]|nr:beta-lactamase family protein [candidate division KSB1 bacterium]